MKHFEHMTEQAMNKAFLVEPSPFDKWSNKSMLAMSLGATMYTPGTSTKIAQNLIERKFTSLTTNVLCLEDSISDNEVEKAEANLFKQLELLSEALKEGLVLPRNLPLIFIRIRSLEQLERILKRPELLTYIVGFNVPKFSSVNGEAYLSTVQKANNELKERFYVMPILESEEIIYLEHRFNELLKLKRLLDSYKDLILNIRIGGTDFSSLYGIRRGVDFNIYNIFVIAQTISDIVNVFGRAEQSYTISGVVWEYFPDSNRMLKPQLRYTNFYRQKGKKGLRQREEIISKEIDGLVKEIILDKANNLVGKTVIHPTHIRFVNGLQSVTYEEYKDAISILEANGQGVIKGENGNKMNEIKPHYNWAKKTIEKSKVYGVLNKHADYIQLF